MKRFLQCLIILGIAWSNGSTCAAPTTGPSDHPNILFFLIDDMGYTDLGCYGGTRAKTPVIDRMASQGVRFTNFYVSAPICSPSRTAFLTGQYPNRWRITSYLDKRQMNHDRGMADWLDPAAPSVARFLHDAGYYTAHVGKWHMGGQRDVGDAPLITQYGFDTSLTSFEGLGERILPVFRPEPGKKTFDHEPTRMSAELGGGPIHWVDRDKVTAAYVDRALIEIDNAKKSGKPFYLDLWPDDVHSPCQSLEEYAGDGSPFAEYSGVLTELDHQFQRVFDRINNDEKLRNNTLIILASDNGPEKGLGLSGDLRGSKGQLYEGGIKQPLIAWGPGILNASAAGTTNDSTLIAGMDFSPSVLSIAHAAIPADVHLDGENLSAALLGDATVQRKAPVMWFRPPDRPGPKNNFPDLAMRDGDWKLLVFRDGTRAELFDIKTDPNERKNQASSHQDVVQKMSQAVIDWDKAISSHLKAP
jgi:uncharacterized sulfatase